MALTPAKAGAGMTVYNRQSGGANDLFTYEILGDGKGNRCIDIAF